MKKIIREDIFVAILAIITGIICAFYVASLLSGCTPKPDPEKFGKSDAIALKQEMTEKIEGVKDSLAFLDKVVQVKDATIEAQELAIQKAQEEIYRQKIVLTILEKYNRTSEPKSPRFIRKVVDRCFKYSDYAPDMKYNRPLFMLSTIRKETDFRTNIKFKEKNGSTSFGICQINSLDIKKLRKIVKLEYDIWDIDWQIAAAYAHWQDKHYENYDESLYEMLKGLQR